MVIRNRLCETAVFRHKIQQTVNTEAEAFCCLNTELMIYWWNI